LAWGRYLAVAGAYAACYELTRYFSFSHWTLTAGLRLACLFLVPRRYWVALAIGEALPTAESAALHAHLYGTLWAVLTSIPLILVCMPVVGWLRARTSLLRDDGQLNMGMVMFATLACALLSALDNCLTLSTVVLDDGTSPSPTLPIFLAWTLGAYLGALTITPSIMALRERLAAEPQGVATWHAVWHSRLTRDALLVAVPALALLMLLASQASDGMLHQATRFAMGLPVVLMTLRHGWHGSAIGGMLASIAMASTAFQLQDPAMIQAQTVLAFVLSTSLLFGVRVARRMAASHVRQEAAAGSRHH
jgi:glucose-6-phosphate-specific signal transduction histidine kinase